MVSNNLIDGRALADQVHQETVQRIARLKSRDVQPGLTFVRVGEDPASKVYVGMKERMSARLGILSETRVLAESTSETELLTLVAHLNSDSRIHGILVQAPLPGHIHAPTIYVQSLREGRGRLSPD
jgi:methylenetetrahydrofolate dehydrogenase (NADP+)/methenyltetrahydrofolate cyclohydrolase